MKLKYLLLYALLFFIPSQLGKHFFLPISIISGVRIDYLAPTFYLTDILIIVTSLFYLKDFKIHWHRKIFILFVLLSLNIIFALSPFTAFYKVLKFLEIFLLFFIIQKSKLPAKNILIIFATSTLFQLILSTSQILVGQSLQGIFYFFGERYFTISSPGIAKVAIQGKEILRAYGTFSHPNSLAGFYLLQYVFILYQKRFNKFTFLKYLVLGLSSMLIFISFSKIAIILYLGITGFYLFKNLSCKLCLIGRLIGLIVLSYIFISAQGDSESIIKRISLIQDSIKIIFHYPILGVGFGNYLIAQSSFPIKYSYYFLQPVHNIFLLFIAEAGIPIFILTFFFLYQFFKVFIKKQRLVVIPLIIVIFVTGFFDHYWLTLQQNILLVPVVFGLLKNQKWQ